jgi:hypothetical protein
MFRYIALGLIGLAIALSTGCSSTTNVTGVDIPTRTTADALPPSTGNDIMGALPPSTGNDIMNTKP